MAASQAFSPHTQANIADPSWHTYLSRRLNPSQRQLQPTSTTQQDSERETKLIGIGVLLNWLSVGGKPCFVTFASKFHDLNVSTTADSVYQGFDTGHRIPEYLTTSVKVEAGSSKYCCLLPSLAQLGRPRQCRFGGAAPCCCRPSVRPQPKRQRRQRRQKGILGRADSLGVDT